MNDNTSSITNAQIKDKKILDKLLRLDFTENIFSLLILMFSLGYSIQSLLECNYFTFVAYMVIGLYVYTTYYGDDGNLMHSIKSEDKLLTSYAAKKHQERIAVNLSEFLTENGIEEVTLDNWELDKLRSFLKTKKIDNPTAFLISDIYKNKIKESTENIEDLDELDKLQKLKDDSPIKIKKDIIEAAKEIQSNSEI